jgi:PAS domain S-box-containing protein
MTKHKNKFFVFNLVIILSLAVFGGYELQRASMFESRKEQWKNVLAHGQFAMIAVDENGKIQLWSEGAEKLLGYNQEIIGRDLCEIFPNKNYPSGHYNGFFNENVRNTLKKGGVIEATGKLLTRDGKEIDVRVVVRGVFNGHETYVASIVPSDNLFKVK